MNMVVGPEMADRLTRYSIRMIPRASNSSWVGNSVRAGCRLTSSRMT
jgi:hypothetical protein